MSVFSVVPAVLLPGRIACYTLAPRQCNLRRNVSKNDVPAGCTRLTVLLLRWIVTVSPWPTSALSCPSALKMAGAFDPMTFIWITESSPATTDLFDNVCGQIGVIANTFAVGQITGPPAASEYAVDPVGELTINPSHLYLLTSSPLTFTSSSISRGVAPRTTTKSLSAS